MSVVSLFYSQMCPIQLSHGLVPFCPHPSSAWSISVPPLSQMDSSQLRMRETGALAEVFEITVLERIQKTLKYTKGKVWAGIVTKMEECDRLDSEVTEFQCEASEATSQDDEDEVEELQNRYLTQ